MTWATRSLGNCARCLRTIRRVGPGGQPVALNRFLHISSVTRQEVASPEIATSDEAVEQTAAPEAGPSSTPSPTHVPYRTPNQHKLTTLRPAKLTSSDYVDLSGRTACNVELYDKSISISYMGPRVHEHHQTFFPHGTHGFFYLARSPQMHFLTSELRFRITDSSAPGSFELGRDLILPYGLPWTIPLAKMVSWPSWFPIIWKLMEDGLVPYAVKKMHPEFLKPVHESGETVGRVLHSYNQPFIYNFEEKWPGSLLLLGRDGPKLLSLPDLFDGKKIIESNSLKGMDDVRVPIRGTALLSFVKNGKDGTSMRCLRIVNRFKFQPRPDGEEVTWDWTETETTPSRQPKLKVLPGELVRVRGTPITVPIKSTDFMDPPTNAPKVEQPVQAVEPAPAAALAAGNSQPIPPGEPEDASQEQPSVAS
ncbi:hypothetical protein C8Q80DRAFT_639178 [Daedaleopsis nitida]|nr:hypothetical protein C8Q80DRAFT_639178 [Daedaleopsis nitida]